VQSVAYYWVDGLVPARRWQRL